MKTKVPKILASILSLALLLSFTIVPAFATEVENKTDNIDIKTGKYVCSVPLYHCKEYPNDADDGHEAITNNKCGIHCLSMVATYLTNKNYTPEIIESQFAKYNMQDGVDWVLFERSAQQLGLNLQQRVYTWAPVKEALKNGQVVISLQGTESLPSGGHFIVLTGLNEDGKVLVNDPLCANHQRWGLNKDSYTEEEICANGGPYWIYGKKTITEIPLFHQNDYPDVPFSHGSVATSGCGITCMAMVASYLLEKEVFPDELALEYNKAGSYNSERMEKAAEGLGLTWVKSFTLDEIMEHLKNGKVCIALMTEYSIFTDYGHFIVLKGLTDDGKILVNDPWGPNYNRYPVEFENGFEIDQIKLGLSGGWIFGGDNDSFENKNIVATDK